MAIAELADHKDDSGLASRARQAAVKLSGAVAEDEEHGVLLLAAIKGLIGDAVAIRTSAILEKLDADENLPFSEYRKGEGLNAHGLARLLKPFVTGRRRCGSTAA